MREACQFLTFIVRLEPINLFFVRLHRKRWTGSWVSGMNTLDSHTHTYANTHAQRHTLQTLTFSAFFCLVGLFSTICRENTSGLERAAYVQILLDRFWMMMKRVMWMERGRHERATAWRLID